MALLEGNSFVVFYYFSASEIWPDKKGGLISLRGGLLYCNHQLWCNGWHGWLDLWSSL